eukprot:2173989-Rhodomonas_salina.1
MSGTDLANRGSAIVVTCVNLVLAFGIFARRAQHDRYSELASKLAMERCKTLGTTPLFVLPLSGTDVDVLPIVLCAHPLNPKPYARFQCPVLLEVIPLSVSGSDLDC